MTEIEIVPTIPKNFVTDEIPRYEAPNPLNLSKLDLIQKKREVEEIHDMYPHLPLNVIEDLWCYHHIMPKDELTQKIESGFFEKKKEIK